MKDYSKADFIIKNDGSYVCLEVDSLPEFSMDSQFAEAAKEAGITYGDLVKRLIEISLSDRK
jgi:D-alanine-D-alanine ligase